MSPDKLWFPEQVPHSSPIVRSHGYRHVLPETFHNQNRTLDVSELPHFAIPHPRILLLGSSQENTPAAIADRYPGAVIDIYELSFPGLESLQRRYPRVHDLALSRPPARHYDLVIIDPALHASYPGLSHLAARAVRGTGFLYRAAAVPEELPGFEQSGFLWKRFQKTLMIVAPALVQGGADKALIDLIQGLDSRRFPIIFVTTEPQDNHWIASVLPHVKEYWDLGSMAPDFASRSEFFQGIIQRKDIDLFYVMHSRTGYDMLPFVKRFTEAKTITQFHLQEPDGGWIGYALKRYANLIDKNIVITEHLRQYLLESFYVEPRKVDVIYLGVPIADTCPPAAKSSAPWHILYPARLDPQKAPERLIAIALKLKALGLPVIIDVVGDGPLRPTLESAVAHHGLAHNLVLHGSQPAQDMPQWYRNSHGILLTSDYEGLPLVILEAMAHNRPVIAPAVGAIEEVLTSETGYLVAHPDQVQAYVDAITTIVTRPIHAKTVSDAAFHRIQRQFSAERTQLEYTLAFNSLCQFDKTSS